MGLDKRTMSKLAHLVGNHNRMFGYIWAPDEFLWDPIKLAECMELLERSVIDNVDYIKEVYHYVPPKTMDLGGWCID